ncbi:hypothetical protein PGTUg99_035330 [Puccinia graminis f. sp. tritici]|uniref:Uncharacterized protein n=1 Tax=Puccinia graminis f. sp. tritici TaxID=56615 RepID=A0A5B0P7B5_PUCGR|nr:hypothetical protein PGTUg99_035330 [Puccinia graminis f. sp. tritici]
MIVINDHGEYIGGAQLKTGPHDGVWEATLYPLFLLRKCLESSNLDFDLTIGDDGLLRSWTAKRGLYDPPCKILSHQGRSYYYKASSRGSGRGWKVVVVAILVVHCYSQLHLL